MKIHFAKGLTLPSAAWVLLCGWLAGASGLSSASLPPSPVGVTWDCVLSSARQQGLAYLTFGDDFSFTGYELRSVALSAPSTDPRGGGIDSRGGSNTISAPLPTQFFGATSINGPWGFDAAGRVIGSFVEVATTTNTTLPNSFVGKVTQTSQTRYGPMTVSTNITLADVKIHGTHYAFATNLEFTFSTESYRTNIHWIPPVSYSQTFLFLNTNHSVVTSPTRFTFVISTPSGKVTGTAVPAMSTLANLGGNWYGSITTNGMSYQEFFQLTPWTRNMYQVSGSGPGYTNWGVALLSSQKEIGFCIASASTNTAVVDGIPTTVASTNYLVRLAGGIRPDLARDQRGNQRDRATRHPDDLQGDLAVARP